MMAAAQNFKNHARIDPPFHFFVAPVLLINVFVTLFFLIHGWRSAPFLHLWLVILAVALLLLAGVARSSALRAQDRLIRLEETLRYQRLLGSDDLGSAQRLSLRQMIALRFASDAELPGLLRRALAENMEPKAIKQAITEWKPDLYRV
jgi:hypothetical protein